MQVDIFLNRFSKNLTECCYLFHQQLQNDIQQHQSMVDSVNDAGLKLVVAGVEDPSQTEQKLEDMNRQWDEVLDKSQQHQDSLEDALREVGRDA